MGATIANPERNSDDAASSGSATSLLFSKIRDQAAYNISDASQGNGKTQHNIMTFEYSPRTEHYEHSDDDDHVYDIDDEIDDIKAESGKFQMSLSSPAERRFRRLVLAIVLVFVGAWFVALIMFLGKHTYLRSSSTSDESLSSPVYSSGRKVMLGEVLDGQWRPRKQKISWIEGPNGEDGLLLKQASPGNDYLVVEDIKRGSKEALNAMATITLMKKSYFLVENKRLYPKDVFPSKDLKKVLITTDRQKNWRYSFYAKYWIFDVETQTAEPLDPAEPDKNIQLASWSPQSDAIVFTRDKNLMLRRLSSPTVDQITTDGGKDLFYGVPDWVYEEEVLSGNSATWWAEDGKFIAFLRTNESMVPEFPIQYFLSRPSNLRPSPGEENYPDVRRIKYPKAGAPNPIIDLLFYDFDKGDVFQVKPSESFSSDNLLITEVVWAGSTGKALIRESNRESDIMRVVLVDALSRTGKTVRIKNLQELDGGWFEVSEKTKYIPADPLLGRSDHGYIDTVVYNNFNHLGYFTPLDNPEPILLTSGDWEVENSPSAVDLKSNLIYFIATKESPIQRHVYSVRLNGTELKPLTDISMEGYYSVSFSSGSNFALLDYEGPNVPWQRVISTHGSNTEYNETLEDNSSLVNLVKKHDLPIKIYSTINVDGFDLQVLEQRPSDFSEDKTYPVLFYLYGGPGSQTVDKKFRIDFQSYVVSNLGYIVVTVDGRGTGFIGRKARAIVRGNLGYYEAHDQIEAGKVWSKKRYVDPSRIAIWGWSYGGFMTLKTLEQDAGNTFSYGMAVAPVTDWKFYDSIYTERYMKTPKHNPSGYENSSISNMTALHQNVRFLIMHGSADDNVHIQNSLTLIDKLDLAGVENYDFQIFPDSDHSISFHNANHVIYHKLNNWIINAFNGEWLKTSNPVPKTQISSK
ncbi:putative dipeptidyl-aminopeptidase B [Golovinomyces cichoracearum]|uniref:dipeptidyl-peptidase IV n=1 Tax=Golovinomyces cichoracearum TaxID=62708 RepID=A0A420ISV8_9PEZI|nr:putative dipeptidyl-aminopeptidase B [Golovinomyces cichoracearum]